MKVLRFLFYLLMPVFLFAGLYTGMRIWYVILIAQILLEGKDPGTLPVRTFDNGTATVNTEICAALGLDFDQVSKSFAPYCTKVQPITTAESFDELG